MKKILIADSDINYLSIISEFVKNLGYEVITESDPEKTVETIIENNNIDMILMDIKFKDNINAEESARHIIKKRSIPIILLTANYDEAVEKPLGIICYGYVIKDSDNFALRSAIKTAFELSDIHINLNRSNEELYLREERLRDIIFSIGEWVWEVDENCVYTYSSIKGSEYLDRSQDYVIGKKPFDFMPTEEAKRIEAIFKEHIRTKDPIKDLENFNIKKNGDKVWLLTNAIPVINKDGNIKGFRGVDKDITTRKKMEKLLNDLSIRQDAILSAVPDIIMEVDNNKVYTWANKAGFEFFGEDVIGKEAVFYFEGVQDTYNIVKPLFQGDENIFYVESWQRRLDGEKRLLAWWCRVLKDENGNVKGALSTARDITDQRNAEKALKESEDRFKRLAVNSPVIIYRMRLPQARNREKKSDTTII